MWRILLACILTLSLCCVAKGQGCYGGSPGSYGYSYDRGSSYGSFGNGYGYFPQSFRPLPESAPGGYGYGGYAPPAVYESRTPYYTDRPYYYRPPVRETVYYVPQASYGYRDRGALLDARVRVGSRGFTPGGY